MRAILMAAGLLAATPALAGEAQPAPPAPLLNPGQADAGSKAGFARTFSVAGLKGDLGSILLAKFVAGVRTGKVDRKTGGGVAMAWACYDVAGDRVWLSSTDEMADKEKVDTITIVPREANAPAGCASLPSPQKTAVDGAIRIGMTKADLLARLGAPSNQKGDWLVYRANPTVKGGSFFTAMAVRIDNGKVVFIEASNRVAD